MGNEKRVIKIIRDRSTWLRDKRLGEQGLFSWEKSSLWWGPAAALLTLMKKVAAAFSQML